MRRLAMGFLVFLLLLTSCGQSRETGGRTSVWLDVPVNGLVLPPDMPVNIEGHAASPAGLERVDLFINGDMMTGLTDFSVDGSLAYFQTAWLPTAEGNYAISVVAVSSSGEASQPDVAKITIGRPTATPTITLSPTPVISITPTLTPVTPTVPPPTLPPPTLPPPTLPPPTLPPPTLPPPTLPPPTLPPPTVPPPDTRVSTPGGLNPGGGTTLACAAKTTLSWAAVSDPSGISAYKLQIERSSDNANWSAHPTSPQAGTTTNSFALPVECGWYYRWRVLAIDGKGNQSPYSDWAYFGVTLN